MKRKYKERPLSPRERILAENVLSLLIKYNQQGYRLAKAVLAMKGLIDSGFRPNWSEVFDMAERFVEYVEK